jgi:hypothetical protein
VTGINTVWRAGDSGEFFWTEWIGRADAQSWEIKELYGGRICCQSEVWEMSKSRSHTMRNKAGFSRSFIFPAGTPNRKPLGLKSLRTYRAFAPQDAASDRSTNPSKWSTSPTQRNPRGRRSVWIRSYATLVGGPALIGCEARAKLVPRLPRMRHVPGATTQAVAASSAASIPTRRHACRVCEFASYVHDSMRAYR